MYDFYETKKPKKNVCTSGDTHCLALSASGRVYFWGSYNDVEMKNWADIQPLDDPRKVQVKHSKYFNGPKGKRFYPIHVSMLKHKAIAIACGFVHNAVIVEVNQGGVVRNKLVTWGMVRYLHIFSFCNIILVRAQRFYHTNRARKDS